MMRHHTARRKRRAVGSQRPEVRGQKSAAAVGSRHVTPDTTRRRVRRHGFAGVVLLACVLAGSAKAAAPEPSAMGAVNLEFRDAKRSVAVAMGISLLIHAGLIGGNFLLGLSIGITQAQLYHYAAFIPIIFALCALPISLGGLGVRESLYGIFLGSVGVAANQAVLVSILFWFSSLVWALPGGVLYAIRKDNVTTHQMEEQMVSAEGADAAAEGTVADG